MCSARARNSDPDLANGVARASRVLALASSQQTPSAEPVTIRVVSAPKKGAGDLKFDGKALSEKVRAALS